MYNEFEPWWVGFPENQGSNYWDFNIADRRRLSNKKWLASLPMWEYAHVLTVITACRCGGEIDRYVNDLYKKRMNPILRRYYDRLEVYRFHRAILMRKYESLKNKLKDTSVKRELEKMRVYAYQTRKALRGVCKDFEEQCAGLRTGPKRVKDTVQETYPV